jgi:hypothetical protein
MTLNTTGLSIGDNFSPSYKLDVAGNARISTGLSVTATTASTSTTTGALLVSGGAGIAGQVNAASFNASSDYRAKENIIPLTDLSCSIDNLKPVSFYNKKTERQDMGFLAHEVQEQFPYLVNGEKDGEELQTLNYIGLIGLLVKEIQELKAEVKELKNR